MKPLSTRPVFCAVFILTLYILTLSLSVLAQAATLNVPSSAYPTIQAAVNAASNGDTVMIADGTYTGPGNVDIDFGGKNITVTSQHGAASTIIDCQGSSSANHRGFYLHSGETAAVISGLTVENGYEKAVTVLAGGGGILNNGSGLTIQDCIIKGNSVTGLTSDYGFGGGIYAVNGNGPVEIVNCIITGNTSSYGGGIFDFSSNSNGSISLSNCVISNNIASVACGGVYSISESQSSGGTTSPITLTQCSATGNLAISGGGGIDNEADNGDSLITLTHCTASGNMAFYGAGIFNENDGGIVQLTDCTITNNAGQSGSGGGGGGVFNDSGSIHGTTTLTRCVVRANLNSYNQSGGISNNGSTTNLLDCDIIGNSSLHNSGAVSNDNKGVLTLVNCTLASNASFSNSGFDNGHGTIFNNVDNTITLTNCTITGNTTTSGGDIYSAGGTTLLANDILTGNLSAAGSEIVQSGGMTNVTYCDIQGGYPGTANINADPLFVSATDFHLQPGSPCLDAGTAVGAPTTTIDGQTRPNPPSIGAYELTPITHVLWNNTDGAAALWNYNSGDGIITQNTYGPYTNWTAEAIADGPDDLTRVLWDNTDGRMSLWSLDNTTGTFSQFTFGPYTNWTATALSVGTDNTTHVLWTNTDGRASLWNYNTSTRSFTQNTYGPYPNWTAEDLVDGPDGQTRLLWDNTNGTLSLWSLDNVTSIFSQFSFGPYAGWTANGVSGY
jgi:hypothetical protein